MTNDERLALLFRSAQRGMMPADLREWLIDGILRYVHEGTPLDQALGLAGRGIPSIQTRLRLAARDDALRQAHRALDGDLHALSDAIRRFERRKARAWQDQPTAPDGATEVERHLHAAWRAYRGEDGMASLPTSTKRLRAICSGNGNTRISCT